MCGIVGYTGHESCMEKLLAGLTVLEYRGYDSAGVALLGEELSVLRAEGKLIALKRKAVGWDDGEMTGIGHTRWATHGSPDKKNAHPHTDPEGQVAVVHNGIIENYRTLKEELTREGAVFSSETDTEVIPHLLARARRAGRNPIEAIWDTVGRLTGSFALGILFADRPNRVYGVRRGSPLIVAEGKGGTHMASDILALQGVARGVYPVGEDEIAVLTPREVIFFDRFGVVRQRVASPLQTEKQTVGRGRYATFMEKEMAEFPRAVEATATAPAPPFSRRAETVYLVGCGSAYHAGMVGELLFERTSHTPARAVVASEFRYREIPLGPRTPVIFLSQSGETADTLASLRLAKEKGAPTYAVVNVPTSAIAREADGVYLTQAGPEVAVATTKAYGAQVAALCRLALGVPKKAVLTKVVKACEAALSLPLEGVVPYLTPRAHAYYIGRDMDDAICREGCLKLKEISYLHAESYAAGELKHGTISLIDRGTPVIAVATQEGVYGKTLANVEEVLARGAEVWLLADGEFAVPTHPHLHRIALPHVEREYAALPAAVVLERIALGVAKARGYDPDKPRNLAKSVTVE